MVNNDNTTVCEKKGGLAVLVLAVNIWKSYMCTAVEETNIEAILAAMNTTELLN